MKGDFGLGTSSGSRAHVPPSARTLPSVDGGLDKRPSDLTILAAASGREKRYENSFATPGSKLSPLVRSTLAQQLLHAIREHHPVHNREEPEQSGGGQLPLGKLNDRDHRVRDCTPPHEDEPPSHQNPFQPRAHFRQTSTPGFLSGAWDGDR